MKTKDVAVKLGCDERLVSKYKGAFRYHRSYFYSNNMSPEALVRLVKSKIPEAVIVDSGDHWHEFVGGAKSGSAKDSFMWVKFTV
jgi:hypothetical protein